MNKYKILIADDDDIVRKMLVRYFQGKAFEVIAARDGKEAVEKEEIERPDLVILDVGMAPVDGYAACKDIRAKRSGVNYIPIIFLSGLLSEGNIIMGLELGADDFVTKPFEPLELLTRARNLLKMKDFISKVELLENTIYALIKSIEARDYYTGGHSLRVAKIALGIGKALGLGESELQILEKSSMLHDIGKLGIPDRVLNKPGVFDDDEQGCIREHPSKGEEICVNLRLPGEVLNIIRSHHEKLDGSGYPDHLRDGQISQLTRIVTVADMFDAMTTNRPYRATKSEEEALAILHEEAREGKLDITIVDALREIQPAMAAV
jgi:putative two-component system response regulator